jgi:putative PIN family toxin of toxin-antitoxin system
MRALDVSYRRDIVACCKEIEVEVERNLFNKFGTPRHRTASLMNRWLLEGIRIEITGTLRNTCRDRSDDVIVECAVLAKADFIVTGDKDLLSLSAYGEIEIVSPAAFIIRAMDCEPKT